MITIYAQLKIIPAGRKHREYVISFLSEFESGDPLPGWAAYLDVMSPCPVHYNSRQGQSPHCPQLCLRDHSLYCLITPDLGVTEAVLKIEMVGENIKA